MHFLVTIVSSNTSCAVRPRRYWYSSDWKWKNGRFSLADDSPYIGSIRSKTRFGGSIAHYIQILMTDFQNENIFLLTTGDGPIGVILAPTRELSQQIYTEAKKFCKVFGISVVCCYGGGSKWEQSKDLEQGAEIVVATPGSYFFSHL